MLTLLSRAIGAVVLLALAAVGLGNVVSRVLSWKDAHDEYFDERRSQPPAVI